MLRVDNALQPLRPEPLSEAEISDILGEVLTPRQQREFENTWELNASLDMGAYGRFRINVFRQRQASGLVIRRIISHIPSVKDLHLPPVLERLAMERRGLILITGMTGSGKSTTLAAMLNHRNEQEQGHILTIEDPIEFYHEHKKSVVTQREVGVDTESYATALKNALRQRPDVILVGEIRDREVMDQALTIAETGHLCMATMHTNNAYQAIERIVNFFPEESHNQVRLGLSMNLKAIISQRLLPGATGGLVPALEVMLNEALIRDLIHEGKYDRITDVMEQNAPLGMCTFDQSLLKLFGNGLITEQTAISHSDRPGDMKVRLRQFKMGHKTGAMQSIDTSRLSVSDE